MAAVYPACRPTGPDAIESAATRLLQMLTSPPESRPYDWLMALAALRLASVRSKGDPVLDWFDNDNFNVVVLEGLRVHYRRHATTT